MGSAPPSQLINQVLIYILFSYIKNLGVLGLIHFHIDGVLGFYSNRRKRKYEKNLDGRQQEIHSDGFRPGSVLQCCIEGEEEINVYEVERTHAFPKASGG